MTAGSLAFTAVAPVIAEAVFYLGLLVLVCLAVVQWRDIRRAVVDARTEGKLIPLLLMMVCAAGFVVTFMWYRWPFGESSSPKTEIPTPPPEDFNLQLYHNRIWLEDIRDGTVHRFKSQVDVVNRNPFVVYVQRVSRFGSIEGRGSPMLVDMAEGSEIADIHPDEAYMCISEAVPVELKLTPGALTTFTGEIGCELRVGKSRGAIEKTWAFKRQFIVDVAPNGQIIRYLTKG